MRRPSELDNTHDRPNPGLLIVVGFVTLYCRAIERAHLPKAAKVVATKSNGNPTTGILSLSALSKHLTRECGSRVLKIVNQTTDEQFITSSLLLIELSLTLNLEGSVYAAPNLKDSTLDDNGRHHITPQADLGRLERLHWNC